MKYCKYCMSEIEDGAAVCPVCGKDLTTEEPLHHLQPGTVLAGRYVVGAALGEGGFGITYLGINTNLDLKVAIKEYFPFGYVYRMKEDSSSVTSRSESADVEIFEKGKTRFLSEAKTLARLNNEPGVVSVHDFFKENNTAYIVMEYLEGQTLKEYLSTKGRLSYEETLSLLMPAMRSLSKVHEKGLIHRDISPDNIMLTEDKVKLLDFGAARYADGDKSLSVMLKHGYAPEEQYRRKGEQGPWTDVYALSATIYKCITGATPDESNERIVEDNLKKPSEYGVEISPECEAALMKGLAINPNDRYRTVNDLIKGLTGKDEALVIPAVPVPDNDKTVLGETGPDPDKTVFEDDPDKTVFTNKPEYPVKPRPVPVYKEKADKPKERPNKRAVLIALFSVIAVISIIVPLLLIPRHNGNVHTHTYGEWTSVKQSTCTESGEEERTCSVCGEKETRMVAADGHNYGNSNQCSRCGELELKYFDFTLNNSTYSINAKDKNNMPAKVIIPSKYNGKPVTIIGFSAFSGCSNLKSVTIPDSVTSIGFSAFSRCSNLKSVTIPDSVTSIGNGAFDECSGLTKIEVAKGNTVYHSAGNCLIETKSKTLIAGCKNSVIPADGSVTSIGDYAFFVCSGLSNITIPDSITSIDRYAFLGCSSLTSVTIPDSVTSIGEEAFSDCDGITSVTIGNGVTSIGKYAFYYCSGLASISYKGTKAQWNAISKDYDWNCDTGNYTIHCTDGDIPKD